MEEDGSDRLARQLAEEKAKEEARMRLRSQVLKRGLPRPLGIAQPFLDEGASQKEAELALAEEAIKKEMVLLLTHDAIRYPIKGIKPPTSFNEQFEEFTEEEMHEAHRLLREELKQVKAERGDVAVPLYTKSEEELRDAFIFAPSKKRYVSRGEASREDILNSVKNKFETLKSQNKAESSKAVALEKKLGLYNGGYEVRIDILFVIFLFFVI